MMQHSVLHSIGKNRSTPEEEPLQRNLLSSEYYLEAPKTGPCTAPLYKGKVLTGLKWFTLQIIVQPVIAFLNYSVWVMLQHQCYIEREKD